MGETSKQQEPGRVSVPVEHDVRICQNCKWGEENSNKRVSDAVCHWIYKNRDKFPKMAFYVTLAESEHYGVYGGSTNHWWPRHVKNKDALKCEVFESKL